MLRVGINLDQSAKEFVNRRKVEIGENFDVIVTLWDDGVGEPSKFDTFISEIWYNDKATVVELDLDKPPLAAALADHSETVLDAFSLRRVFANDPRAPESAVERGTPLTRPEATFAPAGLRTSAAAFWESGGTLRVGYKEASGRAGLSDFENPFQLTPDMGKVAAVAGRASARKDARGVALGETNMIASCNAFLGSVPVPVITEVSTIHVV